MLTEALVMATTVWYIPGWMLTDSIRPELSNCISNVFPEAKVEFKSWDGNRLVWPLAVESADKESWRLAFEAAMLPREERENLVIVGHSLGGRMAARVMARLAEHDLRIKQGILLAAAIPNEDPDIVKMGGGSTFPVFAICNPGDITLRYVYALAGGEKAVAFGANGTLRPVTNVCERVVPRDITKDVEVEGLWGKAQFLKDIANHHDIFYFEYLKRVLAGEPPTGDVMVPQGLPTIDGRVMDMEILWDVIDECNGWKLERNKVTGHARIVDPDKTRRAWGSVREMARSFEKVRSASSGEAHP